MQISFDMSLHTHTAFCCYTNLKKIFTIFKKSTLKFGIAYKIAKSRSTAEGSASRHPACFVLHLHNPIGKIPFHNCMFLNVFTRLCYQLRFLHLKCS